MLDFNAIQQQFAAFSLYQTEASRQQETQLETLCMLWDGWAQEGVATSPEQDKHLVAIPLSTFTAHHPPAERPAQVTVVATDGSQIFPDHHIEPTCYLLNFSRIAFQYGTLERPVMDARQELRYLYQDQLEFGMVLEQITPELASIIRDLRELEMLLALALEVRMENRPIFAVADGTLIRWMNASLKNPELENMLIQRYRKALEGFQQAGIPVFSYISQPTSTETRNLFAHYGQQSFDALNDRMVFEQVLPYGRRSACFKSSSTILKSYGEDQHIVYAYIHVGDAPHNRELIRIEMPFWVTEQPAWLDQIHGLVLDETRKGKGYPVILSEAHERAVIRHHETELFYQLLDQQMREAGLTGVVYSKKQQAKRRPVV